MNMTGYVLFWYLLGVKLTWGHAHKTRSWYLLGVTFKKSDEHPRHFYMGSFLLPPPPPPRNKLSPLFSVPAGFARFILQYQFNKSLHLRITLKKVKFIFQASVSLSLYYIGPPRFGDFLKICEHFLKVSEHF